MAAILPLSRLPMYRRAYACEGSPMMVRRTSATGAEKPRGAVWLYFAPYMVLILVTVVLLVIPSVHEALSRWSVGFAFPETRTAYGIVNAATAKYSPFHPLVDSGTVLLLTCIISYALLHGRGLLERSQLRVMLSRTLQKTRPVAVSLILLLIISKLMSGSGQTLVLAQGITHVMGRWYALLAGVLGVIGSFVTGSNMSSNILFTDVQVNAAADLGVSSSPLLAGADRRRLRRQYDLPQQDHPGHHSRRRTWRRGHGTALHAADGSDPHFGHWGDLLDHPVIRKESKS